jgi:hypothetical protein
MTLEMAGSAASWTAKVANDWQISGFCFDVFGCLIGSSPYFAPGRARTCNPMIRVPQDGNLFRHSVASRDGIPGPMDSGHPVQHLGERNSRLDFSADEVAVYEKRKFQCGKTDNCTIR